MVRKKVRNQFLLFKNPNKQTKTNGQTNKHGKEKFLLLKKKYMVRRKGRTRFFSKKNPKGKEKGKNSILTLKKKVTW